MPKINEWGEQWCSQCKHWLAPDKFHKGNQWCKACRFAYNRARYDKERKRKQNLRSYYKQDSVLYERLYDLQEGACAICKRIPEQKTIGVELSKKVHLLIDHDRTTNKARGLLCQDCYKALEWIESHPGYAETIQEYLEQASIML